MRKVQSQTTMYKEEANRRTPKFDIEPENIYSMKWSEGIFRLESILFTRMKIENTGPVNTDSARQGTDSLHVFFPFQAYLICTMVRGYRRDTG